MWRGLKPPPLRYAHTAVTIDGKMYVFGGYDGVSSLNDLYVYDPAAGGSWTDLSIPGGGTPPSARYSHTALTIDDKMYIFGGSDGGSNLNDLHVYDPAGGGTWTDLSTRAGGTPPSARLTHSAVPIEGKMYVFGGDQSGGLINELYEYTTP